jgi:hypothetical protein
MNTRAGLLVLIVAALVPTAARAQTNDHFFRSWSWPLEPGSGRGAGMAGAVAALSDDASAAVANPALVGSLTKTELVGALVERGAGKSRAGDSYDARTGLGLAMAAGRLGPRWALGGYVARSHSERIRLDPAPLPDRLRDSGTLEADVTEYGFVAAWRARPRLQLGVRLAATRLKAEGEYTREPETGLALLRVDTEARSTRLGATAGALIQLTPRLSLGVSASNGIRWKADRTARNPLFGAVLDPGSSYFVVQPSVVSAAVCVQPSLKLLLMAQLDRVAYREIQSSLVIGQGVHARDDYALADAWEPRFAAELSLPFRRFSLQLRAGAHLQQPSSLRYAGANRIELAAFPGALSRTRGSAGASLVTLRWLRFDVAGRFGGGRSDVVAGTAVRF